MKKMKICWVTFLLPLLSIVSTNADPVQNKFAEQLLRDLIQSSYDRLNAFSQDIIASTHCKLNLEPEVLDLYQRRLSFALLSNLNQVKQSQQDCCPTSRISTPHGELFLQVNIYIYRT